MKNEWEKANVEKARLIQALGVYPQECVVQITLKGFVFTSLIASGEDIVQAFFPKMPAAKKAIALLDPGEETTILPKGIAETVGVRVRNVEGQGYMPSGVIPDPSLKKTKVIRKTVPLGAFGYNLFAGRPFRSLEEKDLFAPYLGKMPVDDRGPEDIKPEEARRLVDLPAHLLKLCR